LAHEITWMIFSRRPVAPLRLESQYLRNKRGLQTNRKRCLNYEWLPTSRKIQWTLVHKRLTTPRVFTRPLKCSHDTQSGHLIATFSRLITISSSSSSSSN